MKNISEITDNRAGVYRITCTASGNTYVGSAVNLRKRTSKHHRDLRNGTHHNKYMQRSWARYGDVFVAEILVVCGRDQLIDVEQRFIDALQPEFNATRVAGSFLGMHLSLEAREKISAANKGKTRTPEHCAKLSAAKKGKPGTPCTEKNRLALITRNKVWVRSEETRKKISDSRLGKKLAPFTEQHKSRISAALRAKDYTHRRHVVKIGEKEFDGIENAASAVDCARSTVRYWIKIGLVPQGNGALSGLVVSKKRKHL